MPTTHRPNALSLALQIHDPVRGVRLHLVGPAPSDHQPWVDRDLASMMEGFFGEILDLGAMTPEIRQSCVARLPPGWSLPPLDPARGHGVRLWITAHDRIVGTLALTPPYPTDPFLSLFALYVDPASRKTGAASAALSIAHDAAVVSGLHGIKLETFWTWGTTLRYYLRHNFWLRHWKHSLQLVRGPEFPRYRVEVAGDTAAFVITRKGVDAAILRAQHLGERLGWETTEAWDALLQAQPYVGLQCEGTFALSLASLGWPLIRSTEHQARSRNEFDIGGPEALARRIEVFEAVARQDGVRVDAPRIPGISYRSMEELERAWAEAIAADG